MQLSIHTDSKKVLNTFESIIGKQIQSLEFNDKYVYFICKQDFIEHVYMTCMYVSWLNTSMTPTQAPDDMYIIIETGNINRAKRYNKIIKLDEKYFTYQ